MIRRVLEAISRLSTRVSQLEVMVRRLWTILHGGRPGEILQADENGIATWVVPEVIPNEYYENLKNG